MKTKTMIQKGAASIFIELKNGNITVTHGTDSSVLLRIENAKNGSWDKIWETLRNIEETKSHKMKAVRLYDIHTFMSTADNETYLVGKSEGKETTIVFSTFELLEWLDIHYMKEQVKKYIDMK